MKHTDTIITWGLILGMVAMLVSGCITTQDELDNAELWPYALEANQYIGQHFHTMLADADLARYRFYWGRYSQAMWADHHAIWINCYFQNDPEGIQIMMQHEMFHCVSEIHDNLEAPRPLPQYFNGVKILDWIAWGE
jgi:hypothetical protein